MKEGDDTFERKVNHGGLSMEASENDEENNDEYLRSTH